MENSTKNITQCRAALSNRKYNVYHLCDLKLFRSHVKRDFKDVKLILIFYFNVLKI